MKKGKVVVLSGPSGAGKTSLCKEICRDPRIIFSVSATTRKQRPGEVEGKDYYFIDQEAFQEKIGRGEFIEYAMVHGYYYGTLKAPLEEAVRQGLIFLLEIDVQGASIIRQHSELEAVFVFLMPPDLETLRQRLRQRGSEGEEAVARRLKIAEKEMTEHHWYHHLIISRDPAQAVAEFRKIIELLETNDVENH